MSAPRDTLVQRLIQAGEPAAPQAEACRRNADGRLHAGEPAPLDHPLRTGTLACLAIDQPA